ncbi:MAG: TolC family protein, partial [Steroidobacter sp.]
DAFTEAVLARNASLEAMRQAVVEAVAGIEPAGSLDDPMLMLSVAPNTWSNSGPPSGRGVVQISQALPWWGTLDAREEAARAEAEAARYDLEALKLRLIAVAHGAFADWVFVHRSLEINADNQTVLADLRSIARVRYTTGQTLQQDVLQADVERTMLKHQALELERQRTTIQARMNALLNRRPEVEIPAPAELPSTLDLPPQEVLAERALAAHPQLQRLEAVRRAAEAQVRVEEKARYPQFRLNAGYNSLWEHEDLRPMVGISINVPFGQGKYEAAIDAARARTRRTASTLDDQRAMLLADLASAYAAVREATHSLALYRDELVPLARNSLDVAQADYGGGRGDFLNVLTAERHQLTVEFGLARLEAEYFRRLAELDRASGGALRSLASPSPTATPIP